MRSALMARIGLAYAVVVAAACAAVYSSAVLRPIATDDQVVVLSQWRQGKRIARQVLRWREFARARDHARLLQADFLDPNVTVTVDVAVEQSRFSLQPWIGAFSLVPGRDGVMVSLGNDVAFITVDDLLAAQAYDRAFPLFPVQGQATRAEAFAGADVGAIVRLAAADLHVDPRLIGSKAHARRVRWARIVPNAGLIPMPVDQALAPTRRRDPPDPSTQARVHALPPKLNQLDRAQVAAALRDAALHIARNMQPNGLFRYSFNAVTNANDAGYSLARHAATTHFLAEASAITGDPSVNAAMLQAANHLRTYSKNRCGAHVCIAEGPVADLGSSALALLAFADITLSETNRSFTKEIAELTEFLRSEQRPDGEFRHLYDIAANASRDVQYMYFTEEAAMALARASRITRRSSDLDAAARALAYVVDHGWHFFGSRYYVGEQHWTCQAVAELWDRRPNAAALAHCLRWLGYQERLQLREGESAFDAPGAFGFAAMITPQTSTAATRGEAAAAALYILRSDPQALAVAQTIIGSRPIERIETMMQRALIFLLRTQLRPGPDYLFANPSAAYGAISASPVDLTLRIDYAQHAGGVMLQWLSFDFR